MTAWRYQVAILAGRRDPRAAAIRAAVAREAADLGLAPGAEMTIVGTAGAAALDDRAPIAAVFLGGPRLDAAAIAAVRALQARHAFILPVVPDLERYQASTPPELHGINGAEATSPAEMGGVALRVVEELGLVRRRRHAFLSYCRRDSARAAEQVYRALDRRGWQVFLDTHSVTTGVPFQPFLWDRLNDADLLVLFDTPRALTSTWVDQELARAANLGVGVLQVVWPGHARSLGSDFAHARYLDPGDFTAPAARVRGGALLRDRVARELALTAESIRARSVAARRTRLVRELAVRANDHGLVAVAHPERFVEVRGTSGTFLFVPTVGSPRSHDLHEAEALRPRGEPRLLYDPAGLLDASLAHLGWLNGYLPVKAVATSELSAWLGTA